LQQIRSDKALEHCRHNCCAEGLFVRIQSWSNEKKHPAFEQLLGKRVRVTIETLEDERIELLPANYSVFQDLYDSEINFTVSGFYDDGFTVLLGDDPNGIVAETKVGRWEEAKAWLIRTASEIYPRSRFAWLHPRSMDKT